MTSLSNFFSLSALEPISLKVNTEYRQVTKSGSRDALKEQN